MSLTALPTKRLLVLCSFSENPSNLDESSGLAVFMASCALASPATAWS